MSSYNSPVIHNYGGVSQSPSSASWTSQTTTTGGSSTSTHSTSSSISSIDSHYPASVVYRDPISDKQRTEVKVRVNHNKQVVCVVNYNQRNNVAGEPHTEYRDASCYYNRS